MAYTKQVWANAPEVTSPLDASSLNHIEDGLEDAASDAENALAGLSGKYVKPGTGIPGTDLTEEIRASLALADTAIQSAGLTKTAIGLGLVDNTADISKPISTAMQTALDAKQATIAAGTTGQYWRGDKTWQTLDKNIAGLGLVDNTADAAKSVLSATKLTTARTINSVSFDGTANITVADATKMPLAGGTFTGAPQWGSDPSSGNHLARKSYVDSAVSSGGGFVLTPVATKTASYTAAVSDWIPVNSSGSGTTINITLPLLPPDGALVGIYIVGVSGAINVLPSSGAELLRDGSAITTMPLYSSGVSYTPSSVWRYEETGNYWYLISYTTLPFATDIYNSTATGRSILTASNAASVRTAISMNNVDNTSDATKWAATKTLTNTRVTPRVGTTASAATPTINTDIYDVYGITALATNITGVTVSGTPTNGQKLWVYINTTGTRTITWGSSFESSPGVSLPTGVTGAIRLDAGFVWNSATAKWRCVGVA